MTFQSVLYSFLQLFNEFSFALSYASNFALNHTLSPEFFFPRVKSFRIHGNRSFQSRIFRKIYADSRFRQNNIPEPLQKKAAQFGHTGVLRGFLSAVTGSSHARMKAEACTSPAKHSTPPSWGRRLDSVPLYLIQRFLERFDLPDKNQQILKLIGIRHFFYVLTG